VHPIYIRITIPENAHRTGHESRIVIIYLDEMTLDERKHEPLVFWGRTLPRSSSDCAAQTPVASAWILFLHLTQKFGIRTMISIRLLQRRLMRLSEDK
jgi:hypothetical protein